MRKSLENPEFDLADFPLILETIKYLKRGEKEYKAGERKVSLRSEKLVQALNQFSDLAPVIEFLLDPHNSEDDRVFKVEEINSKSKDLMAGMYNSISFESGSGGNITLQYINNGKFSLSYTRSDKNK
jgi:hypothetical protein